MAHLKTKYGVVGKFSLVKAGQIDWTGQACLQCEERKGVHRNKLVSRHSIVHNRLIERIRLRLVHMFVGWSNIRIFNSFNVLFIRFFFFFFFFFVTCGEGVNLR